MPTTIIFGILAIVFGYLCGSIPVGLWIGKLVIKADIRNYGSGTTGATNVIRTCGFKWGVLVFLIDILKSIIPTFLTVVASNNEIVIPGDHIIVPEGTFSVLFGKNSFLQNLTALFSIISTYTIISDRLNN